MIFSKYESSRCNEEHELNAVRQLNFCVSGMATALRRMRSCRYNYPITSLGARDFLKLGEFELAKEITEDFSENNSLITLRELESCV